MKRLTLFSLIHGLALLFIQCFPQDSSEDETVTVVSSEYVLPFPVGNQYLVTQANNSHGVHGVIPSPPLMVYFATLMTLICQ